MTSMPPRTLLYSLPALGVGTAQVESLRSYIERLSLAHHRTARQVVSLVLAQQPTRATTEEAKYITQSWLVHSGSPGNLELLARLQAATGQQLGSMTLARFANAISLYKAFDQRSPGQARYCPLCFTEDLKTLELPYGRLLWELKGVDCCPIHKIKLQLSSGCWTNACSARLALQNRPRAVGVCPDCGSIGRKCDTASHTAADATDITIANRLSGLLALNEHECELINGDSVRKGIQSAIDRRFDGKVTAASRAAGIGTGTICSWFKHREKVGLTTLAQLSIAAGIDLSPMLKGEVIPAEGDIEPSTLRRRLGRSYIRRAASDHVAHEQLMSALTSEDAPSLSRTASAIGTTVEALSARFPELADSVVAKRKALLATRRLETYATSAREYMRARLSLIRKGKSVNAKTLQSESGLFCLDRSGARFKAMRDVLTNPSKFEPHD
jgi:hypothetical protein